MLFLFYYKRTHSQVSIDYKVANVAKYLKLQQQCSDSKLKDGNSQITNSFVVRLENLFSFFLHFTEDCRSQQQFSYGDQMQGACIDNPASQCIAGNVAQVRHRDSDKGKTCSLER